MAISVVGFDIGSLHSHIAVARGGGIEIITNEYSERFTPTCVAFAGNMRLVGTAAKLQHVTNVNNTFINFPRLSGKKRCDISVAKELKYQTNNVCEGPDGRVSIPVTWNGDKFMVTPEQLLAMQMTKLKEITECTTGSKVVDVVINVPTYYTDCERRAVLDATRIAGLNCVKLVNDLTAIGTAYGFYCSDLPAQDKPAKIVAFVSVGHSTTQVAICAFNSGKMKVLSTAHDPFLGGRDFDRKLFDKFAAEFLTKAKLDITKSPKAVVRLLQECEKLRKLMSANAAPLPIGVECIMEGRDLSDTMNRAEFEDLCVDLVERFTQLLQHSLSLAKVDASGINAVELVGGSSRIPMLKNAVQLVFKQEGRLSLNADEAVARGCAFQAAICSPAFKVRDFGVIESCTYSIILQVDNEDGDHNVIEADETDGPLKVGNKDMCVEVFPQFHPIPSSRQISFTRRGFLKLEARYANPEELPNQNVILGTFRIGNPAQMDGEPHKIRIKLRINTHGIFTISQAQLAEEYEKDVEVDAPDETSADTKPAEGKPNENIPNNGDTSQMVQPNNTQGEPMSEDVPSPTNQDSKVSPKKKIIKKKKCTRYHDLPIEAVNMQFTAKQLNDFCEFEGSLVEQNKLERERINAKNTVEEYVYEIRSKIQGALSEYVTPNDRDALLKLLDDTENWLYEDGENVNRQTYVNRLSELKSKGDPIVIRGAEHTNRPIAIDSFNRSLVQIRKVLDSIKAGEPTYDHLNPEQIKQLQNAVGQYESWLNHQLFQQNSRPMTIDPILKVSDIVQQQQAMESVCHPIINIPKPAPQAPPPSKADVPNQNATGQHPNTNNANEQGSKLNHSKGQMDTETMDLD